jgi:hypothetical protein
MAIRTPAIRMTIAKIIRIKLLRMWASWGFIKEQSIRSPVAGV